MARSKFIPNPDGLRELLGDGPAKAHLKTVAIAGAAAVRAATPVISGFNVERIRVGETEDGEPAVVTDSPFWHLLEYGSANNPPYRPFARGLPSVTGVRYEALGKGS